MFRTVVAALFVTLAVIPFLPTSGASDSCAGQFGQQIHVGGEPSVRDFHSPHYFDCCKDLTVIPIAAGTSTFYLNARPPVDHAITNEPHPNSIFLARTTTASPLGGVNPWLFELENTSPGGLPGAAVGTNSPIDAGSSDYAVRTETSVWLYEESNGVPNLQTGGTGVVSGSDACHDPAYTTTDDVVI